MDAKGKVTLRFLMEWDERGFETKTASEEKKNKETSVNTKKYPAVDSVGNWTECLERAVFVIKGQTVPLPPTVTVREIEYYQ